MDFEDREPCLLYSTNDYPIQGSVQTIENGVESMTLDDESDMLDSSNVCAAPENPGLLVNSENRILHSSAEAFIQLQREREDTKFSRTCLFCRKHFTGNRTLLLQHFTEQHNFFIGQPDNLVFINEFLDILENMLNKLQCLFCRKIFKDWFVLKEHMRKKMHKRINPADSTFDRFYMTNYLNVYDNLNPTIPRDFQEVKDTSENDDPFSMQDDEKEIDVEPKDESSIICLYCDSIYFDFDEIMNHLKLVHNFDFKILKKKHKLCFYSQVKLINFIRRKVLVNECTICDTQYPCKENLVQHMTESGHIKILPDKAKWDQSEFYFSTLDTDYLLCGLQDDDDDDDENQEHSSDVEIISEDIVLPISSILIDENLRRTLL